MRDLQTLPKAHLHLHLELGMRPGTLADLAAKAGEPVPTVRGYGSFTAFSEMCRGAIGFLRDRADWERLADEICADAAADGATYIEPSLWATGHREVWGSDEAVWDLAFELFEDAGARHGVCVRFMAPVDRAWDDEDASVALAELAVSRRSVNGAMGIVGLGLHNDEVGHPPGDFVTAFAIAREGGLLSTPHAGELEHGQFVADSIDLLGANRIQHGVRSFEVPGLVERLAAEGVCLDVCPTSNVMLSVFPSLVEHPLPRLLDAGVRCSLNADDPLLFGPGILDEYELARRDLGLSDELLASMARSSFECSGAPDDVKAAGVAGVDAWLTAPG
ncbi:MAG: adenosine deaminase [Ilumatobacteraceae bacterium]